MIQRYKEGDAVWSTEPGTPPHDWRKWHVFRITRARVYVAADTGPYVALNRRNMERTGNDFVIGRNLAFVSEEKMVTEKIRCQPVTLASPTDPAQWVYLIDGMTRH